MARELLSQQSVYAETEGEKVFRLNVTVNARQRCSLVLRGTATGSLSVVNSEKSEKIVPVKMQGASNEKNYVWVTFETGEEGVYEVSFLPSQEGAYEAYFYSANMEAPKELLGKLHKPLKSKETGEFKFKATDELYGPFGSVWGNAEQDPQFDGPEQDPEFYRREGYIHLGHDIEAEAGDIVMAVADGEVVRVGDSGGSWGHFVVVEHHVDGHTFTVTYEHLQNEGRPTMTEGEKTVVKKGDVLGRIIKMTEPGEATHLHISMHMGKHMPFIPKPNRTPGYIWSNKGATSYKDDFGQYFNGGNTQLYEN